MKPTKTNIKLREQQVREEIDGVTYIRKCCPDCGSTNIMHYDWCKIHLTPVVKA